MLGPKQEAQASLFYEFSIEDHERIIADTAYGSGPMLGWLVDCGIARTFR
jgi:hypothetical protein